MILSRLSIRLTTILGISSLGLPWVGLPSIARAEMPDDPRRPAAITTESVPVVPPEIFARLRAYQNVRAAAFRGWGPDGKMLVQTRFGNTSQLHRVREPGGRREQITFFDEPVNDGRYLPGGKQETILLSMGQGGNENFQLFRLDPEEYSHRLLTDGKSRHTQGPVSADGRRVIVSHNGRNGRDTDVYVVDIATGKQELLLETTNEFWRAEDWSRDGKRLLMSRYVSINESYPALFDMETKRKIDLDVRTMSSRTASSETNGKTGGERTAKVAIGTMAFSPDGRTAYVTHDADGEFLQLYAYDLDAKTARPLTVDIAWDVSSVTVAETGTVAFTTNEDGYGRLYVIEDGKRRAIDLPPGNLGSLDFTPDGRTLGFTRSSPTQLPDAYSYDLTTNRLTRWTFSETGGLDPRKMIAPELVRFKSFDGREIAAFYYRPPTAASNRRAGVLVQIHGGPESQYTPDFSGLAQFYATELGIAVIAPNVRGSAGYGKTFLQLDNGRLREDSVKDIGALLDWIAERPELDSRRVAVSGGSYGGYMVLASLTHYGDRLRAGIDNVGIANWVTFLERTSPYRQDLRRVEYGDERDPEMRKFLAEISPAARADRITSALLVAHGENDPRVPFFEAEQIAAKVRSLGRTVWTVYADNEGHGFGKRDNRDYLSGVEALFLRRHLVDDSTPDR